MKALRNRFAIECFFETGTHLGETSLWAADYFPQVITVELSDDYFREATMVFAGDPRIVALHGDSLEAMKELAPVLPTTLFWLDAHYSGGPTAGIDYECPLLEEIDIIAADLDRHIVMIDDARLFFNPPGPPIHRSSDWPRIDQVVAALTAHHPMLITVFDDIILAVHETKGDEVLSFLPTLTTQFHRLELNDPTT